MAFPLVLGSGKRLFADGAIPAALRLLHSKVIDASRAITPGRIRSGQVFTTVASETVYRPPPPIPCTNRAITSTSIDGADAARTSPTT